MASPKLSAKQMNMLNRLMVEVRPPGDNRNFEREMATGRYLLSRLAEGMKSEKDLRKSLARYVRLHGMLDPSLSRWEDEGGAIGR